MAKKPVHREKYPDVCSTWGDWIRARRIDLGFTKVQLSSKFHVDDTTIYLWEHNRVQPSLTQIPKIIEFLGKNPFESISENLGDKLRSYRQLRGLSQKKLSEMLGVDQSTLASWERGIHQPIGRLIEKLKVLLNSDNKGL
jgi:transcriptional regulator with XRE-family HTH domain